MPSPLLVYSVDFHFSNYESLKASFLALTKEIAKNGCPVEIELKLHWTPVTLRPEYHDLVVEEMRKLQMHFPGSGIFCQLPRCFHDPLRLTCFPHCGECVLQEAAQCSWPMQMKADHYRASQRKMSPNEVKSLRRSDFAGDSPPTWIRPSRRQIRLLAEIFSGSEKVVDFGCGNGFLAWLLREEGLKSAILGVDPLQTPSLRPTGFYFQRELELLPIGEWSLFSSLADYHVPLSKCFSGNLPVFAAFFVFPQVCGRGGRKFQLEWREDFLLQVQEEALFAFSDLEQMGYVLTAKEEVASDFYPDAELRVYRRGREAAEPSPDIILPYPWEEGSL